jgi:hypothetical protein
MLNKSILAVLAASAIILAAGAVKADIVNAYVSSSAYTAGASAQSNGTSTAVADSVDWGIFSTAIGNHTINNSTISSGSSIMTPQGEMVGVTSTNASQFAVFTNGLTTGLPATRWDGDFGNGTNVLYTSGASLEIVFGTPVTGVGFDLQTKIVGAYGFTLQAYDVNGNLLGSVTSNIGLSTGSASSSFNTAVFAGLTDAAGDISYVVITDTGANIGNGFAIDTSLVYHYPILAQTSQTQTTPEPGTLGLLGAGLIGLGWARRRAKRA